MALSANNPRTFEIGDHNDLPVKASSKIYEGSAVGLTGGYARALNAGDSFGGFAEVFVDNSAGADGAVNVNVNRFGLIVLPISGLAVTDIGKPVYASDDNTFTLTSTGNSAIGRVVRWSSAGVGVVAFRADRAGLGLLSLLTDSTGGTADGTVSDVGASFSQSAINNNFKELAVKINQLVQQIA